MELLKKLFINLHFSHAARKAWRARLRSDWSANDNHVYIIKNGKRHEYKGIIPEFILIMEGHDNCVEIDESCHMLKSILEISGNHNRVRIEQLPPITQNDQLHGTIQKISIRIVGNDNCMEIDKSCHMSKSELWIYGNHNRVRIEHSPRLFHLFAAIMDNNRLFMWGKETRCEQLRIFVQDQDLIIGKGCMLSDQIEIMTSDAHTICDKNTGEIINRLTGKMIIGDHVWIGRRVFLTKRANIPNGCVVGANSVVTRPFTEENCVIAGFPAKAIKQGITWHEISTSGYMEIYQKTK